MRFTHFYEGVEDEFLLGCWSIGSVAMRVAIDAVGVIL